MTRDVLFQALKMLGHTPIAASNGKEALDILQSQNVDIVITDIHMPVMNGLVLLSEIRKLYRKLPVILITGFDAVESRSAVKKGGANALLLKPFKLNEIEDVIEESIKNLNS